MRRQLALAVMFVILIGSVMLSPLVLDLALGALALWSLAGPRHALRAMWLSMLIKYLNPALVTYDAASGLLLWAVLLIGSARALTGLRGSDLPLLVPLWLFAAFAALASAAVSPAPTISLMKVVTFAVVVSAVIVACRRLALAELESLGRFALTLATVVALLSLLTILQPSVAYLKTGTGLQGIFSHPQTLGLWLAPAAAWLLADLLLLRRGRRSLQIAITVLLWLEIFLSEARTAAIAATIGVAAAAALHVWRGRRSGDQSSPGKVVALVAGGLLAAALAAATTGLLSQSLSAFVLKRGERDFSAAFQESRGLGIQQQWNNFLARPWTGWGFGVQPDGSFPEGVVEIAGIPISAPVEKGFIPTAVLEESGAPGGLLLFAAIALLVRRAARGPVLTPLAACVAALAVNLGEAVMLSPGGVGLHVWLVIGLAVALGERSPVAEARAEPEPGPGEKFPNLLRGRSAATPHGGAGT